MHRYEDLKEQKLKEAFDSIFVYLGAVDLRRTRGEAFILLFCIFTVFVLVIASHIGASKHQEEINNNLNQQLTELKEEVKFLENKFIDYKEKFLQLSKEIREVKEGSQLVEKRNIDTAK